MKAGWINLVNFVMRYMIQRRKMINVNVLDISHCLVVIPHKKLFGQIRWVILKSQVKCTKAES